MPRKKSLRSSGRSPVKKDLASEVSADNEEVSADQAVENTDETSEDANGTEAPSEQPCEEPSDDQEDATMTESADAEPSADASVEEETPSEEASEQTPVAESAMAVEAQEPAADAPTDVEMSAEQPEETPAVSEEAPGSGVPGSEQPAVPGGAAADAKLAAGDGAAEEEQVSFADELEESEPAAAPAAAAYRPEEPTAGGDSSALSAAAPEKSVEMPATKPPPAAAEKKAPAVPATKPAPAAEKKTPAVPAGAEPITEYISLVSPEADGTEAKPGTEAAKPAETAAESAEKSAEKSAKPEEKPATPEPPMSELEKLWKPVKQNPADFTAWTLLIQYAEAQCFMEEIRDVLSAFLNRYPYCYGYWKKYCDLEKKRGTLELCNQVYERGLTAVPLSVDLWLHYLGHVRAIHEGQVEPVRAAFERAVAACGLEFRSDRLWEQYASWETTNKEPIRALAVYRRAIAVPTLSYRTHFENLEQFVGETPPQDLLTVEEFLEARRAVLAELKDAAPPEPVPPPSADLLPPGCDEAPPGEVPTLPILSSDEEGVRLRSKILTPLRELHKENEKQVSLRWTFEEAIKRPYFHVKPLERGQLKNWKSYLDFEIEQGDQERIRVLFERCLIACTLYEEYWLKYIRYLETPTDPLKYDPDRIRAVFERVCWVHLPTKPAVHMVWATFEEKQGDLERAAEIVDRLSQHVSLLEVTQRRVNLARRRGRLDLAEQLYAEALKASSHRQHAVILAVKFVRFLYKVRDDRPKAEEVLREAIRQDPANQRLYMQMVDLGFQARPTDDKLVLEAFEMALAAPLELPERMMMAHRRVEFLEDFGDDIHRLASAQEEYFTLARAVKAEAKKMKEAGYQEATSPAAAMALVGKRPATESPAQNGPDKRARANYTSGGSSSTATPARKPYQAPPATPQFSQPPPAAAPQYSYNQPRPQYPQQYPPAAGYQYPQQQQGWGYPPGQYQYPQQYPQYGQPGYQYPGYQHH